LPGELQAVVSSTVHLPVTAVAGSYRDPSGQVLQNGERILRSVSLSYQEHFDKLVSSGLYDELTTLKLLVPHTEENPQEFGLRDCYKLLAPQKIDFLSYPYEWSFSQLKDAALLTLEIAKRSLSKDMVLKDASAYNVQFVGAQPIFIDTLSFEAFDEYRPWIAYRQFCEHFLAPLALMRLKDVQLGQLLKVMFDGIPLTLASKLLPKSSLLNFGLLTHIHLHAQAQKKAADAGVAPVSKHKTTKLQHEALLDNLRATVESLTNAQHSSAWSNYYQETNYSDAAFACKKDIVAHFVESVDPKTIWDLGANTGEFSEIAVKTGDRSCIAFDVDHDSVDFHYQRLHSANNNKILPLVLDLTNPTPGIGWLNKERQSVLDRGPADMALALALIHHLSIAHNWPLSHAAEFFASVCNWLVIEFVPRSDSQVCRMLASREDIFQNYNEDEFVRCFSAFFDVVGRRAVLDSDRHIFLMKNKRPVVTDTTT
jgi:ribosomal protein L11 methylase PrmA